MLQPNLCPFWTFLFFNKKKRQKAKKSWRAYNSTIKRIVCSINMANNMSSRRFELPSRPTFIFFKRNIRGRKAKITVFGRNSPCVYLFTQTSLIVILWWYDGPRGPLMASSNPLMMLTNMMHSYCYYLDVLLSSSSDWWYQRIFLGG